MSYKGYQQILCENGHYSEEDAYATYWVNNQPPKCLICGAEEAWKNSVNTTNGSFNVAEDGSETMMRIDGFVELVVDKPAKVCECSSCGHKHITCPETYKVPTKHE